MSKLGLFQTTYAPYALAALRVMTGLLYVQHGTQKLFNFPENLRNPPAADAEIPTFMLVTGLLEFVGGALFAVGLLTRPIAFLLSGMMAVAYFMAHAPRGFYPINNSGDLAILFSFVFLYFFFAGPGAFSLDEAIARKKNGFAA
jgi:putative oxidoreductase